MVHCKAEGLTSRTLHNKRHELGHFQRYLIEKRAITELGHITVHDMKAYFRFRQSTGLQPTSIDTIAKVVAAYMNWCVREEYLKENQMRTVEIPKIPQKVTVGFTEKEVIKMIGVYGYKTYLEARNKAVIAMLSDCGLRAMEIRGIVTDDVKENSILINGKGNKQRVVFISPTLQKILIKYERLKQQFFSDKIVSSDTYFLTYQGNKLTHMSLHNIVKDTAKKAKVKDAHPHKFRHFYSVRMVNNGIDVFTLSKLLGHSTILVTQEYLRSMTTEEIERKAIFFSPLSNINKNK